jgi:hypothetical protein
VQEVIYDFGYAEQLSHWLFQADQVGLAEDRPGLYAWYLRPPSDLPDEASCNPYRRVYADREFKVSASAALGELMEGRVNRRRTVLRDARAGEELNQSLFASAFAAFAPPVYVGRSIRVHSSLSGVADDGETATPDTEEESAKFGIRMARMLRSEGLDHFRGLFVKVVYAPDNLATKRVEYVLNRTFHPVLGRL